jgi:hypothetical protein
LHGVVGQFALFTIVLPSGVQYENVVFVQQYSSSIVAVQGQGSVCAINRYVGLVL